MHLLILGGTGFIGEYLTSNLSKREGCHIDIIYYSSLPPENKPENVNYYKIDLTRQKEELKEFVNKTEVLVILTQPNIEIINNIIFAIRSENSLKKIIYLSTILLYNDSLEKKDENAKIEPKTEYEKNKFQEEKKLIELVNRSNFKLCIARLSNVYGDIKNKGLVGKIFTAILKNENIIINGNGTQVRDYIFIEDAVNLLEFLIFFDQANKQEIFNICPGEGLGVNQLLKIIEQVIIKKIDLNYSPAVYEKQNIIGDSKKIITLSNYKFKFNLLNGLEKTYKNYLKTLNR
ncbi:MAG: NAD-dependent epimerase/dehydratase family protein [Patescibacteria group bacterium]